MLTTDTLEALPADYRRLVLQVDDGAYLLTEQEGPADWVNHCCDPNAGMRGTLTLVAMRLTPNRLSPLWAPMLHFYFPLGSLASYKAIRELIDRPFWWDKTSHGQHDPD